MSFETEKAAVVEIIAAPANPAAGKNRPARLWSPQTGNNLRHSLPSDGRLRGGFSDGNYVRAPSRFSSPIHGVQQHQSGGGRKVTFTSQTGEVDSSDAQSSLTNRRPGESALEHLQRPLLFGRWVGCVDRCEIGSGQFDTGCGSVFADVMKIAGFRNCDDTRLPKRPSDG